MFLSRSDPPALAEASLHGMCVSLNSPVVNIEDLPVGPARALIVLHDEEPAGTALTVAIRSLESGRIALFTYQGDLKNASSPTVVMDGALSFAEGMGFLFDEDLIEFGGQAGRQRALHHWRELLGEPGLAVDPGPEILSDPASIPEPALVESSDLELAPDFVLDEAMDLDTDDSASPPAASERAAAAPAEAAPERQTLPLTKFRSRPPPGPPAAPGASEVGRVPIVKVRRGGDGRPEASLLIRLLGSF